MRKIDMLNQLQCEMKEARTKAEELCNDWGWTLSDKEVAPIVINKGQIVAVTDPRDQEEIDNLYREIGRHIGRINQLAAENEQLREELAALKQAKEEQNNIMKEADAMEQPKAEPKKKLSILDQIKKAEQQKKDNAEKDIVKEALETKEVVEETNEYAINFKQVVRDEKVNDYSTTMSEICGDITIDKTYNFKASNNYYYPIVYGCFNEEVAEQARQIIKDKVDRFNLYPERTNAVSFKFAQDKEYPIVVWRMIDKQGNKIYNAYTKLKSNHVSVLSLDENKLNNIIKTSVKSLFSDKPAWRKLDNETLANKFRAVCADIWPEDFAKEEPQDTNEIVVDFTNDPTAGCDDLDI